MVGNELPLPPVTYRLLENDGSYYVIGENATELWGYVLEAESLEAELELLAIDPEVILDLYLYRSLDVMGLFSIGRLLKDPLTVTLKTE